MNYVPRKQMDVLHGLCRPGKAVILYGARRVGKTTLIKKYAETIGREEKILFVSGDDLAARSFLESQSIRKLSDFIGQNTLLMIDEAQYVDQIGLNLKLIVDHLPQVKVIATGSSSFDLSRDVGEPLTGRKRVMRLYPLAQLELAEVEQRHETLANLESRLIFGAYPEVVTCGDNDMRKTYLQELVADYLFKDILQIEGVKYSQKLIKLLQLLAFQIGKEVSVNELGQQLGMSKNTVLRYLDLLEKVFIIFHRQGFSRNLRKEISKSHRYYFYDNGIRNAVVQRFTPLDLREDVGALWENYVVSERLKRIEISRLPVQSYFWRTYSRQEIDLVEQQEGRLNGYEMKWRGGRAKAPASWRTQYAAAGYHEVSPENYLDFIGG